MINIHGYALTVKQGRTGRLKHGSQLVEGMILVAKDQICGDCQYWEAHGKGIAGHCHPFERKPKQKDQACRFFNGLRAEVCALD